MTPLNIQQVLAIIAVAVFMTLLKILGDSIIRRRDAKRIAEEIATSEEATRAEAAENPDAAYEAFIDDVSKIRVKPVRALNYDSQPNEVKFLEAPTVGHLDTTSMDLALIQVPALDSDSSWYTVKADPEGDRETHDAEIIDEEPPAPPAPAVRVAPAIILGYDPAAMAGHEDAPLTGFGGERDCE